MSFNGGLIAEGNKSFDCLKHFLYLAKNFYPTQSSVGLSAEPDARLYLHLLTPSGYKKKKEKKHGSMRRQCGCFLVR